MGREPVIDPRATVPHCRTMAILLAATVATGLIAGLFFAYANNVMPALRVMDDRCFVGTMQRINTVILNPLFLATFVGGLLLTTASAITVAVRDGSGMVWAVAAIALYLVMVAITRSVNIPLNIELERAGDVSGVEALHDVRKHFEQRWITWNLVRAVASVGAFGCQSVTLLLN
jgi:uncharacterized membrane protein